MGEQFFDKQTKNNKNKAKSVSDFQNEDFTYK